MNKHDPSPESPPAPESTLRPDPSRRSFIRSAVMFAMASGAGIGLSACGGGGDDEDAPPPANEEASSVFRHGVASGDPLHDRVILWTRVTPPAPGTLSLQWELASDASFGVIVARGNASTGPGQDYTVKVDAQGLSPNAVYHYRFLLGNERSPAGRTKTLPVGNVSQVKFAVFSCANYPAGYFNAYADAARRNDIDVALHLGDYIYEYGRLGYASQLAIAIDRESDPQHEILTLEDYRRRHAQYRTDPDLRALHAAVPMIAVWDDHDLADNAWTGGAANHDPAEEGSFNARRASAVQAYHEWLPTRLPDPADPLRIYRAFEFGNLASLHMLDTRLVGREQQLTLQQYLDNEGVGPARQLLGQAQSEWLTSRLATSGATWQVLGQQVLMARMEIPLSIASAFNLETLTKFLLAQSTPEPLRSDEQRDLVNQRRVPYNLDAWDGYPAARESVLAVAREQNKNLLVLAGDTHNAWASHLTDATGRTVGVEYAAASVSSPGFERLLPLISSTLLTEAFPRLVDDLRYAQTSERGYLIVTLTPAEARGEWIEVSTVLSRDFSARTAKTLRTRAGAPEILGV